MIRNRRRLELERELRAGPGRAGDRRPSAHRRRELGDDREPEPGPDRAIGAVAIPEVEALEGASLVAGLDAGAVVDDGEPAFGGDDLDRSSFGGGADRVLDQVRERLQAAARVGDGACRRLDPQDEVDAVGLCLMGVPGDCLVRDLAEVGRPSG